MGKEKSYPFKPDYRVPPGETIVELCGEQKVGIGDLERLTGLSLGVLLGVIDQRDPITETIAAGLAKALGPSKQFWLNLDADYRRPLKVRA